MVARTTQRVAKGHPSASEGVIHDAEEIRFSRKAVAIPLSLDSEAEVPRHLPSWSRETDRKSAAPVGYRS